MFETVRRKEAPGEARNRHLSIVRGKSLTEAAAKRGVKMCGADLRPAGSRGIRPVTRMPRDASWQNGHGITARFQNQKEASKTNGYRDRL